MKSSEQKYLDNLQHVLDHGSKHEDRTGTGTIRVFGLSTIYDLTQGFPLLTTKKVGLRIMVEELRWMLSGSTDVNQLVKENVHIWDGNGSAEECAKFGRSAGDLGPIYGHQWRNWNATKKSKLKIFIQKHILKNYQDVYSEKNKRWVNKEYNDDGVDQIKELMADIKNNPNSRRLIVSAWNPSEKSVVNPPPCHSFFQISIMDGTVHLSLLQRSCDFFLGKPINIIFYAMLIHLIAKTMNLKVGNFIHHINDAHIYLDHIDQVKEQLSREPFSLPTIELSDELAGKGFDGLMDFVYKDVKLNDYKSHAIIKAKMSV